MAVLPLLERMPVVVGGVTLAVGAGLAAAPQLVTRPLGLEGQETAMRLVGLADLALVPGLLAGRPRWPWMVARAAVNLAQAAYLHGVASGSSSPGVVRGIGSALAGLTLVDGPTGLLLRRAGR
jgi:hypothetical protein